MKLLVLSDLHLEVGTFRVPDVEVDVVILAGDIATPGGKVPSWACRATNFGESTPIVFVPGNHEFYGRSMSSTLVDLRKASVGTNFHALDGAEVVLGGVRFLGCTLWTDFALNIDTPTGPCSDIARSSSEAGQVLSDFHVIGVVGTIDAGTRSGARQDRRRIFTPEDSMALHRQHRAWLSEKLKEPFNGPTVVVTHHAPHRGSLAARFAADWVSGAFVSELPLDFFEVPVLWIHGHTHTSFDYRVGQCRVVCNPRGYVSRGMLPENVEFNPSLVVELTPVPKAGEE